MLLRYLTIVELKKATKTKQSNGYSLETCSLVDKYKVQKQELNDEISASIYGADIIRMLRLKSFDKKLEKYLQDKINNDSDNISQYRIVINNKKYKIRTVNEKGCEIELV